MRISAVAALVSVLASAASAAPPATCNGANSVASANRRAATDKQHNPGRREAA